MCSAHAKSKCGVLSVAHAIDEVAYSCIGLAKEAKDKRMDTTQRADAGDEGFELTLYGMGKIRVELGEVGFNLSEDGSSAAVHSASGIRAGGMGGCLGRAWTGEVGKRQEEGQSCAWDVWIGAVCECGDREWQKHHGTARLKKRERVRQKRSSQGHER